jgi:cell division protein FtsQ
VIGLRGMQLLTGLALAATAALLLAGAVLWLAQRPGFDFRRIEIHGDAGHLSAATVRTAVSGHLAGNYFTMRLDSARRVFETLPWVASASVRRIWPNRLSVTLVEHRALGQWDDGRLVSDRGVLFVANPAEAEADLNGPLVAFSGPPRYAEAAVRHFHEFAAQLAPLQVSIRAVGVSDRASWSLAAAPPLHIELGRDDPPGRLQERLRSVVAAMPLVVARLDGPAARIDARYSNGFAAARSP